MKNIISSIILITALLSCGETSQHQIPEKTSNVVEKETPDNNYDPEARLAELGIVLPSPPQPVANYVNGVRTGNLIFLAGKGPKRADGSEITGKLGQDVTIDGKFRVK